MELIATDAAYLAALIDGEGWVGMVKDFPNGKAYNPRYRVTVEITNTNEAIVDWCIATTGHGSKVFYASKDPKWKSYWRWRLRGGSARFILGIARDYMKIKKDQCEAALTMADNEAKKEHFHELNKKGN